MKMKNEKVVPSYGCFLYYVQHQVQPKKTECAQLDKMCLLFYKFTHSHLHPLPRNHRITARVPCECVCSGSFQERLFFLLLLPLSCTDERLNAPQSVSYFNMSELAVISPLIASLNPSFTSRIQSPSDYNEKIMIDRIKDRIGIDWSATRPRASEDVKQRRGQKLKRGHCVLEIRGI